MMDSSLGEDGKTPTDYDYNDIVATSRGPGSRLRRIGEKASWAAWV